MAKRRLGVRKRPRQPRAIATVEAILQAATYILVRSGWEGLTTNRIAEVAGVNIASVYQYFPGKEAIVLELQRRHVSRAQDGYPYARAALPGKSLREVLGLLVGASVQEHRIAPALHRAFEEELPRSVGRVAAREAEVREQLHQMLGPHLRNVPDPGLALYIARIVAHAVIHESASSRPELLDNPLLVSEVVTLLCAYLDRS